MMMVVYICVYVCRWVVNYYGCVFKWSMIIDVC